MSLRKYLRRLRDHLSHGSPKRAGSGRGTARATPRVEALEGRVVPTIVFPPHSGAENATRGNGPVVGITSPNMPIYTIFWGAYWNTVGGRNLANSIQGSLNPIFVSSPFLQGLSQYAPSADTPYQAYVPANGTVQVSDAHTSPANGFTNAAAGAEAAYCINNLGLPAPNSSVGLISPISQALYLVFIPPGIASSSPGTIGFHSYGTVIGGAANGQQFNFGWVSTASGVGALNQITPIISHEVGEALTDPRGTAWQVDPRNAAAWNEVFDNEAQEYTYRLNSYLVQSVWSNRNGAYIVADGNSMNFYLHPVWAGDTFTGTYDLDIVGDQAASPNDTIPSAPPAAALPSPLTARRPGSTRAPSTRSPWTAGAATTPLTSRAPCPTSP
jgi:hypothetical protein